MGLGSFLKAAGKAVQKVVKNPVVAVAKAVINTVNVIKDYAYEKKVQREEKRRKDSQELDKNLQQNQQQVYQRAKSNAQKFAESMGDEAIEVEDASANEIRRITRELSDMQDIFILQAENIENDIIKYVQSAVSEAISEFEEINSQDFAGVALNLNIDYLKNSVSDIKNIIKGNIKNAVRRNLSIDSEECKAIFRQNSQRAKEYAMRKLQVKIYRDAVNSLWKIISDTISINNQSIFTQIKNRLNAIELNVNESLRQLEEIEHTKQLGEEELKKKQTELQNMIDISAWCIAQLNQEVSI